jgi:hypothetical protein
MRRKYRAATFVGLLGSIAILVGVLVPGSAQSHSSRHRRSHVTSRMAAADAPSAALLSKYALLRNPAATDQPALPNAVANGLANWGVDPTSSRPVGYQDGWHAWLVPGSTRTCFFHQRLPDGGFAGTCVPADGSVLTRGMWTVAEAQGSSTCDLIGVVPDGVTVSVTKADGSTVKVPVDGNAFQAATTASDRFQSIGETDSSGAQSSYPMNPGYCPGP